MFLQMRRYLYSFEFLESMESSRASVQTYDSTFTHYSHPLAHEHDRMLTDAGWHCTFCFRYLSQFVFKMTGYSHADRVRFQSVLRYEEIQRKICQGKDVFDMPPEVYSFVDYFVMKRGIPSLNSAYGLPFALVEEKEKFRFLLPGNCIREPDPEQLPW